MTLDEYASQHDKSTATPHSLSESDGIFTVTKDGVVLPKNLKIPSYIEENPHNIPRSTSLGVFKDGKFSEVLRIDAATPVGTKGPNVSHFHLWGKHKHYLSPINWPWQK